MTELEHRKALLLHRIETQREQIGMRVQRLKQVAAPAAAATTLGKLAGERLGVLGPLLGPLGGLAAKGPRASTWIRVAAVASLVLPLVGPLLSRCRKSRKSGAAQEAAPAE